MRLATLARPCARPFVFFRLVSLSRPRVRLASPTHTLLQSPSPLIMFKLAIAALALVASASAAEPSVSGEEREFRGCAASGG